jgi:hypothetical protein
MDGRWGNVSLRRLPRPLSRGYNILARQARVQGQRLVLRPAASAGAMRGRDMLRGVRRMD